MRFATKVPIGIGGKIELSAKPRNQRERAPREAPVQMAKTELSISLLRGNSETWEVIAKPRSRAAPDFSRYPALKGASLGSVEWKNENFQVGSPFRQGPSCGYCAFSCLPLPLPLLSVCFRQLPNSGYSILPLSFSLFIAQMGIQPRRTGRTKRPNVGPTVAATGKGDELKRSGHILGADG
jgi:hypothetical protein